MPPGSDRQWWLTEGTELCFVCESCTHPELVAHCDACDQAVCFICLGDSDRDGDTLCPGCRQDVGPEEA